MTHAKKASKERKGLKKGKKMAAVKPLTTAPVEYLPFKFNTVFTT